MNRQERLADALTGAVALICALFYAFAAGVWYDENHVVEESMDALPVIITEETQPVLAARLMPVADAAQDDLDPMIEDTYLRDDIPLDYETQMLLYGACLEFGVDYDLALAVIEQETNFKNIMGDGGSAYGYFQIWPKWHSDRMAELGVTDLNDPESNFRVGCHFLRECIDKYGVERGLGYYNSGKAVVTRYSRSVLEKMN